jgi:hypothetical protein
VGERLQPSANVSQRRLQDLLGHADAPVGAELDVLRREEELRVPARQPPHLHAGGRVVSREEQGTK